jgi:multiple sugar transport system substrate-binding protein
VPYPEDDWTFDDFMEKARKLRDPKKGRWAFKFDNWMPGWIVWIWANGGDVLSPNGDKATGYFNSPKTIEAVKFVNDMINKDHVAPNLSEVAAGGVNPFLNGDAAMEVAGHWEMVGIKSATGIKLSDIGVAPWPTTLKKPVTVMYEVGFSMSKHCKHPELAWKFIKFVTSKRYQSVYQSTGIAVCARKDVALERAEGNALEKKFLDIVPSARSPWGASVEGYDYVETEGPKLVGRVLNREISVEQALNEVSERIDGYFKIK